MEYPKISLEACRVNSRKTQAEFAAAVGVAPGTVYNWERGASHPSLPQLRKISEISGIPMDFIYPTIQSN